MKNIQVLPTDKPSELYINIQGVLSKSNSLLLRLKSRHIYITSDEEIKEGDCFLPQGHINPHKLKEYNKINGDLESYNGLCYDISKCKKIILTTDQDLIKDGVQAIDDEFLEWFVKNPSCEEVGIQKQYQYHSSKEFYIDADYVDCTKEQYESIKKEIPTCPLRILYKIIISKEEPKQETLEEVAERLYPNYQQEIFIKGAKWQAERMYSEEDMLNFAWFLKENLGQYSCDRTAHFEGKYLEQFKKK